MAERFDVTAFDYAHRGLWSADGAPENSIPAFRSAARPGIGVELDVRPSADGKPVVFHDPVLDRMTAESGLVCERPAIELVKTKLNGTTEGIPLLTDVLGIWDSDAPLLVELKIDGATDAAAFTRTVADTLERWSGCAAAMSFEVTSVAALPRSLMRGLIVAPSSMTGEAAFERRISEARRLEVDFLNISHTDIAKAPDDIPIAVWTIGDEAGLHALPLRQLGVIFDHLDPALVAGRRVR